MVSDIQPRTPPGIAYPFATDGSDVRWFFGIYWPAIIAGVLAAFALEVLFVLLGAALGFAAFAPLADPHPIRNFTTGAAVVEGISAVVALWVGGWVTGRFSPYKLQGSARIHGFVMWCTVTVVGVCIVSSGAAWAFGGFSKVVGGSLSMLGKPLAGATESLAGQAKGALQRSSDTISSFVSEGASNQRAGAPPGAAIKAKRDLGMALSRLFDPSEKGTMADNHAAAVKVLVDDAGMSQPDAERTVSQWTDEYNQLQTQITDAKNRAEAKAREEANEASKDLAVISLCAFVAFLLGATASILGSGYGAYASRRKEERIATN